MIYCSKLAEVKKFFDKVQTSIEYNKTKIHRILIV